MTTPVRRSDHDSEDLHADALARALGRREYLRAFGAASAAGILGSVGASSATAQSSLDEAGADQRIRENQTGPLTVEVVDENGDPLSGADVDVEMREHDFVFGCEVNAGDLDGYGDGHPYRENLLELFNSSVLENGHKWELWEGDHSTADDAVDWLDRQGFDIRGHVCVYPVDYAVPGDVMSAVDSGDAQHIRDRTMQQIEDIITYYGDTIMEWDVVNEVLHRGLLQSGVYPNQINLDDLPSGEIQPWRSQLLADWFSKAESVIDEHGLDVEIVTNDYNTITWSTERDRYPEQIGFLEEQGVELDAIGHQAHIGAQKDGSQDWTYGNLDAVFEHYSQFDAAQRITEFDMTGGDWSGGQQYRADVMEVFLKTAYGHPDVDEFTFWGMWDQTHWRSEAAFFQEDWSEKPALDVYRDLVFDEWWTSEAGTTGSDGSFAVDAFYGEFDVTVAVDGEQRTVEVSHSTEDGDGTRAVVSLDVDVGGEEPCEDAAGGSDEVDGQTVCDVDGDGNYRDVTGDGSVTNSDVTQFFRTQHVDPWDSRTDLFDFDGDDAVGQSDVVALFEYVTS